MIVRSSNLNPACVNAATILVAHSAAVVTGVIQTQVGQVYHLHLSLILSFGYFHID